MKAVEMPWKPWHTALAVAAGVAGAIIAVHLWMTRSSAPRENENEGVLEVKSPQLAAKLDQITEGVSKLPSERTYVVNPIGPVTIPGVYEVCNVEGSGKMHEFLVISPNTQFSLYIKVDGRPPIYDYTYANLAQITDDVDEITAYQDAITGNFIIHIGELKFARSLIVRIHGVGIASRIFMKYTLSPPDERNRKW